MLRLFAALTALASCVAPAHFQAEERWDVLHGEERWVGASEVIGIEAEVRELDGASVEVQVYAIVEGTVERVTELELRHRVGISDDAWSRDIVRFGLGAFGVVLGSGLGDDDRSDGESSFDDEVETSGWRLAGASAAFLIPVVIAGVGDGLSLLVSWPVAGVATLTAEGDGLRRTETEVVEVSRARPLERFELRDREGLLVVEVETQGVTTVRLDREALGTVALEELVVHSGALRCEPVVVLWGEAAIDPAAPLDLRPVEIGGP